jgi:hypothetical protein
MFTFLQKHADAKAKAKGHHDEKGHHHAKKHDHAKKHK